MTCTASAYTYNVRHLADGVRDSDHGSQAHHHRFKLDCAYINGIEMRKCCVIMHVVPPYCGILRRTFCILRRNADSDLCHAFGIPLHKEHILRHRHCKVMKHFRRRSSLVGLLKYIQVSIPYPTECMVQAI